MPRYRMPDERGRARAAALDDLHHALDLARCSAQLAGMESAEFVVHELLVTVIQQIDRAAERARRLYDSP